MLRGVSEYRWSHVRLARSVPGSQKYSLLLVIIEGSCEVGKSDLQVIVAPVLDEWNWLRWKRP